jgi:hypothetical protein
MHVRVAILVRRDRKVAEQLAIVAIPPEDAALLRLYRTYAAFSFLVCPKQLDDRAIERRNIAGLTTGHKIVLTPCG